MTTYKPVGMTPFTAENRKTRRLKDKNKNKSLRKEKDELTRLEKKLDKLKELK